MAERWREIEIESEKKGERKKSENGEKKEKRDREKMRRGEKTRGTGRVTSVGWLTNTTRFTRKGQKLRKPRARCSNNLE